MTGPLGTVAVEIPAALAAAAAEAWPGETTAEAVALALELRLLTDPASPAADCSFPWDAAEGLVNPPAAGDYGSTAPARGLVDAGGGHERSPRPDGGRVFAHPNCRRWVYEWGNRQRVRRLVLARDPRCTLRIKCVGAPATQVDHIMPLSRGGAPFELSNCRGSCAPCNASRGDGTRAAAQTSTELRRPTRMSTW